MSRVTPPVKKGVQTFLRSISSTAKVDRPSSILLSSQSHQLRTLADLKQACSLRGLAVSGSKAEVSCHFVFNTCRLYSFQDCRPRSIPKSRQPRITFYGTISSRLLERPLTIL